MSITDSSGPPLFALWGSMVLRSIRLEFETDRVTAEIIGAEGRPRAILNLVEWAGQTWKPSHTRRLAALRALASPGASLSPFNMAMRQGPTHWWAGPACLRQ